jgi:hypothetical protein
VKINALSSQTNKISVVFHPIYKKYFFTVYNGNIIFFGDRDGQIDLILINNNYSSW